jgi:hypothetical protein
LSIDHTIINTEDTMSVKSLSELSRKRGGVALRARLKHIDDRLVWFGFLRLTDHASKFGISEVQGKIDLQSYRNLSDTPPPERKPGPAASGRVGIYERPEKFAPLFDTPGTLDDLVWTQLPDARPDESLAFERIPMPARSIVPGDVRPLLAATELRESCKLNYQSMTTSESTERIVCPHSLVKASGRWHVRAFDFSRKRFIDFSLPRVLASAPFVEQPAVPSELDDDWHASVAIEFIPHPKLSLTQKSATAREFKMKDGQIVVTVRRALLFYLLDEMRLLSAVRSGGENMADGISVWVNNIEHVSSELARMEING